MSVEGFDPAQLQLKSEHIPVLNDWKESTLSKQQVERGLIDLIGILAVMVVLALLVYGGTR